MTAPMPDTDLPSQASVVVVGGGAMGCSTLYHLAASGISDAVLLERNQLASGTTWHSAAQVRALRSSRNLTELIRYSIDLYSRLERETGQAVGWTNTGSISIATCPDRLVHIRRQESLSSAFSLHAEMLSPAEAKERWPLMNTGDVLGAVWSPGDGRVSPSDLCAALERGARSRGCRVFEKTGVTGMVVRDGRVKAVETSRGVVRCDAVALCTGLWSRENASLAGVEAPVWPCEHFYLLTRPIDGVARNLPTLSDHDGHLYIRDEGGGLLVGCFEPLGKPIAPDRLGHDFAFRLLEEDWTHFEPMMLNALHRLPVLEHAQVRMLLNGPESFTPDGSFLLGESAETRGLYLGCGMNSVGIATAGGAGMALAQCILRGKMPMDLHEADPKRFPACLNAEKALIDRVPEVLGKHYEISYPGRKMRSARNLRASPLAAAWKREQAALDQIYGWERPVFFNSTGPAALTFGRPDWFDQVGREVMAAHRRCAVFDQSTLGKIRVCGPDAEAFLDRLCANSMRRPPGAVIYTAMLNEQGGIESDLTCQRLSDEEYLLFVGTGSIKRDVAWLARHAGASDRVGIEDATEEWAVLGVMGPASLDTLRRAGAEGLDDLPYFRHRPACLAGAAVRVARLSYVGEAGCEITCRAVDAQKLYDVLREEAVPAGLYAQTAMRIEKQYLSYGHDLDTDVNPFQAGLAGTIDWTSPFIGRDSLLKIREHGPERGMVSILLACPQAVPLGNEPVYLDGRLVGMTTSAGFGYRVGCPVALGFVDAAIAADPGCAVQVDIARESYQGKICSGPVFDPEGTRMRSWR